MLLFYAPHIIPGGTASAGREGDQEVEVDILFLHSRESGWRVKQWDGSRLTLELVCHRFSRLGLGEGVWVWMICPPLFLFFTTWAQTLPFPIFFFVSGDAKLRLWCSRLESDSVFLLVITLFYTPLLLVLLLLVFVFLTSLMAFFSTFLFGPIISTFIPLSLERKEISCLEFNFQLVSNYNIKK